MEYLRLADHVDLVPVVARWYHDAWGHRFQNATVDKTAARLEDYRNADRTPLIALAMEDNELLGAAQLRFREMDIYPEKEHWLGGVYVAREHRVRQVASELVRYMANVARSLGVNVLYLQTEALGGGLYRRLGWLPIERVNYKGVDVLIMANDLTGMESNQITN